MRERFGDYELDDDIGRFDFERVTGWLASTYWWPGVERATVERAHRNSAVVVGAYGANGQAGGLRVVSDRTTFAWISDVFVDPAHRKKGLALAMVKFAQRHPDLQNLRRWMLATRDAHDVYKAAGFTPVADATLFMEVKGKNAWR